MSEENTKIPSSESLQVNMQMITWAGLICALVGAVILHQMIGLLIFLALIPFALLVLAAARILEYLELQAKLTEKIHAKISHIETAAVEKQSASEIEKPAAQVSVSAVVAQSAPAPVQNKVPEGYQIMPDVYPLLDALKEVRDILLMSEEQRAAMRKQQELAKRQQVVDAVNTALGQGMWEWAGTRLAELPKEDAAYLELQKKIDEVREEARVKSIHIAKDQLHHLMAIGEWMRADEIVTSLVAQFPQDVEVLEVRSMINRERDAFVREQINHMFADLKAATNSKDWRRAHLLAEQLVSRYPNDPEIARLQMDLPTLKENADAQERREEETLFKELLLAQRYDEALHVADRVMARFPGSPTAVELEKLLPKVRDLAAKK